jgi:hypothetical protein
MSSSCVKRWVARQHGCGGFGRAPVAFWYEMSVRVEGDVDSGVAEPFRD